MKIGNRQINSESSAYVIAEMSANHNHDFDVAVDIVKAAKESGADAIKLQTYTPDTMTIDCDNEYFRIKGTVWDGKTLYELYKEAYTPWEWQPELKKIAEDIGIDCFSSPFDKTAVDFLEEMEVPAYKIASFEITDIPLIEYTASNGRPVIISTGIASLQEIEEAVDACRQAGNNDIALLKCTSSYPANPEDANLITISDMQERFGVLTGISDHSMSNIPVLGAVAIGAKIIEKHLTLDRKMGGPDSAFSLEPQEFRSMVDDVRGLEASLGKVTYELTDRVKNNRNFARSLFVVKEIKAGEIFTQENVRSIRPGQGLSPKFLDDIIGKPASEDIAKGTPLREEHIKDV